MPLKKFDFETFRINFTLNIKLIVIFIVQKLNQNRAGIRVGHTITR